MDSISETNEIKATENNILCLKSVARVKPINSLLNPIPEEKSEDTASPISSLNNSLKNRIEIQNISDVQHTKYVEIIDETKPNNQLINQNNENSLEKKEILAITDGMKDALRSEDFWKNNSMVKPESNVIEKKSEDKKLESFFDQKPVEFEAPSMLKNLSKAPANAGLKPWLRKQKSAVD